MHSIVLPGTDISVTRLAFGTASLHHLWSSRARQNLLAAVVDMGIAHFDTSPYYGFGLAERAIGRFLRSGKPSVTVATKFGLYPPMWNSGSTTGVWARKFAGRVFPALSRPVVDWSVERATKSLERSLRLMCVDRVDFLLLHEPQAGLFSTEEILTWLSRTQGQGKIGTWGLAGELDNMRDLVAAGHPLAAVLQVRDSLGKREADLLARYGRPLQFSYGYLGSAGNSLPVREVLRAALKRNVAGSIIVSSRNQQRLAELVSVAEEECRLGA